MIYIPSPEQMTTEELNEFKDKVVTAMIESDSESGSKDLEILYDKVEEEIKSRIEL